MANPWKEKVLAFNRKRKAEGEKAEDMDVVIAKISKLPPGQLKKLLTDEELCAVLRKYGVDV
jgi:hypothetical protein